MNYIATKSSLFPVMVGWEYLVDGADLFASNPVGPEEEYIATLVSASYAPEVLRLIFLAIQASQTDPEHCATYSISDHCLPVLSRGGDDDE